MHFLRYRLEYAGAWLALALVRILPAGAQLALARGLARLAFALMRRRRAIAVENLLTTGVAKDRDEAVDIARRSFESLAETVVESMIVPMALNGVKSAGEVKIGFDASRETLDLFEKPGRGVMLVSAHLGNWELAAKICARKKPVTGIVRRMDNPLVQRLMERHGVREGMDTIDKHDANPMKIVRALKNGRILALLVDQHASGNTACTIDFLGRPARSYTTPAVLQRLTGAPIVIGAAIRNGPLDFTLHLSEPIFYGLGKESGEAEIEKATQDIADRLCRHIKRWPKQYLWAHRRWKI